MKTRPIKATAFKREKLAMGKAQVAQAQKRGSAFLTQEELERLASYDSRGKYPELEDVRNVFLFMAHTGLRYSEICQLTTSDIHDGTAHVYYHMQSHPMAIKLNNVTQSILDHYKGKNFRNGNALPCLPLQKYNYLLQLLCKVIGIDTPVMTVSPNVCGNLENKPKYELITSYSARLTFLQNKSRK